MSTSRRKGGRLLLIGGAANTCLKTFLDLAGGAEARVVLIPHASENAKENGEALAAEFRQMGCAQATVILPGDPWKLPRGTTGVYLGGGDQTRLVQLLGETGKRMLKRFLSLGGLVAGSSAGAACASREMIADGMQEHELLEGALQHGPGVGLTPYLTVDTHFMQRCRYNRLLAAQVFAPGITGVGLDEDTGIVIEPGVRATVVGAGCATFFVPGDVLIARHSQASGPRRLSIGNVTISALSAGCSFDLVKQVPSRP